MLSATTLPPALKWAGGKRWLIPTLLPTWQTHATRLVEPFAGGLAVALGLHPDRALLNDLNPHVVNFWRQLQAGLVIDLTLHNETVLYYQLRARFNELISLGQTDTAEAAGLFYFLNRTGFNGLCRFNAKGFYNVPFGQHTKINYIKDFRAYQAVLAGWEFTSQDFEKLPVQPTDFIYADPPYDTPFTTYSAGGFGWDDQVRLAHWLTQHPGPVVASNQATPRIVELYTDLGFAVKIVAAPRAISRTGDRSKAAEILATLHI